MPHAAECRTTESIRVFPLIALARRVQMKWRIHPHTEIAMDSRNQRTARALVLAEREHAATVRLIHTGFALCALACAAAPLLSIVWS